MSVLVCPYCGEINHSQHANMRQSLACCSCGKVGLSNMPVEADAKLFKRVVSQSAMPVVVNFWGPWLGNCQYIAGIESSLAQTFNQDAIFLKINSEQEQVLANTYKLIDIPAFIVFKSGSEYERMQGAMSEDNLHAWLVRCLSVERKKIQPHPSSI